MTKFIEVRQKDLPTSPTSAYDYGCFLKLRRDPILIQKTFGDINKFVSMDGKTGIWPNEKTYIFYGDLNYYINKIPLSLKEEAEKVTKDFIDDMKQNISVRLGKKISKFDREMCNKVLNNTNNKFDEVKEEIKTAICEVLLKFKDKGCNFKKDSRFLNSKMFNTKNYEFVNDISRNCKVYFNKEKNRFKSDVTPFKNSKLYTHKKCEYFQKLIVEKLDDMFPKENVFNWITKDGAKLPKENFSLTFESEDMYQSKVNTKIYNKEKKDMTLINIYKGNEPFKKYIEEVANEVPFDTVYINKNSSNEEVKFIDFSKSLKINDKNVKFISLNNKKKEYEYKDKILYEGENCLGKYKFLKFNNKVNGKLIVVFLKQML